MTTTDDPRRHEQPEDQPDPGDPHGYHEWKPPASGILEIDDFAEANCGFSVQTSGE